MPREIFGQILKKIGFLISKAIYSDDFMLMARGKYRNRDSLIKVIPLSDHRRINSIKKEILLDEVISSAAKTIASKDIKIPIKFYFEIDNFALVIRDFFQGETISSYVRGSGKPLLAYYENITPRYEPHLTAIVQNIIDKIFHLQALTDKITSNSDAEILLTPRFFSNLGKYDIKKIENESGFTLKKQLVFFNDHSKSYFARKNIKIVMGDLVPGNIIVEKKMIVLIDFEWLCLDNYLFDFTWLWLFLWKYPEVQKLIIKKTIKNISDQNNFRANLIRQSFGYGYHKYFRDINHIWLRYLAAAGESFEAIMKVK